MSYRQYILSYFYKFTFFLQKLFQNMIEGIFQTYYANKRKKQRGNFCEEAGRKNSAIYICTLLFWKSCLSTITTGNTGRDKRIQFPLYDRSARTGHSLLL